MSKYYLVIPGFLIVLFGAPVCGYGQAGVAMAANDGPDPYMSPTVQSLGVIQPGGAPQAPNPPMVNAGRGVAVYTPPAQPMQAGSVSYITGGIGDEERDAIEAVKQNYDLYVLSAGNGGDFSGDTSITITDLAGNQLLEVPAGPIFYAQLPAGTYRITAHSRGQEQRRNVTIGKKPASVHFAWS